MINANNILQGAVVPLPATILPTELGPDSKVPVKGAFSEVYGLSMAAVAVGIASDGNGGGFQGSGGGVGGGVGSGGVPADVEVDAGVGRGASLCPGFRGCREQRQIPGQIHQAKLFLSDENSPVFVFFMFQNSIIRIILI